MNIKVSLAVSILLHATIVLMFITIKKNVHISDTYMVKIVSLYEFENKKIISKTKEKINNTIKEIKKQKDIEKTKIMKKEMRKESKSKISYKSDKKVDNKNLNNKKINSKIEKKEVKKDIKERENINISVEDKIAVIKAKKRIEKIVQLKKELLAINRNVKIKGKEIDNYREILKNRIWSEWVFPEFAKADGLETIISIKIYKDGKVEVLNIEKSSGNNLFDRSALRAIYKASPLPPPPQEMEFALRFRP